MMMLVGVDGGGSKTIAVCATPEGRVVGIGRSGGSNHEGCGMAHAAETIRDAVLQAVAAAGATPGDMAHVHAGLAGMDWPEDIDAMRTALRLAGIHAPLSLENDAFLIVRAGAARGAGVGVGAGAGVCCCIIVPDGRQYVYASYMDQAFDCDIVGRTMMAVVREGDGRGPATALTPEVLRLTECAAIRDLVYGRARGALALPRDAVQRACFAAAAQGDAVAVRILGDFAGVFAEAAGLLLRQYGLLDEPTPVVAAGSRFTRTGPLLFDLFRVALRDTAPHAAPVLSEQEPVLGALRGAFAATGAHEAGVWQRACATYGAITNAEELA